MSKISFESMEWNTSLEHARSKAHAENGRQLRLLEIDREFVHDEWCYRGHIGYVLEGELELEYADRTVRYSPGDAFFLEAGEGMKHKPKALSDRVLMLLVEDVG